MIIYIVHVNVINNILSVSGIIGTSINDKIPSLEPTNLLEYDRKSKPTPSKAPFRPLKSTDPYENVNKKTKEAALAYKKELLARAIEPQRRENDYVKMTGLRCAGDKGSLYLV